MQTLVLKVKDIEILNEIQQILAGNDQLSQKQRETLNNFLNELPQADKLLADKIPIDLPFEVKLLDLDDIEPQLVKWMKLFVNLPGVEVIVRGYHVEEETGMKNDIALAIAFAPSANHRKNDNLFDLYLRIDGSTSIIMYLVEDAEKYPHLYNFKGSWKDAYLLLLKTLKEGWPQESFPEELQRFLSEK